jgi:molybdopterin-guanine dinucleotide biosynthesis protein MobB
MNHLKLISFVGYSGSGKTTLIEKLVRELTQRGLRMATIKYAVPDTTGKEVDAICILMR